MALKLVFDLDDTLYPEREYAIGGFRAAVAWAQAELGVEVSVEHMVALLDEGRLGQLFPEALAAAQPDHTAEHLKRFVKAYGEHAPEIRLFPDAASALDYWQPRTMLALITDGRPATQQAKISALGLQLRFAKIVITGALGPDRAFHKPHPRAFEMMQATIGEPGDQFVYIGDNLAKDFLAPNKLGWMTVRIDRPRYRDQRIHKTAVAPDGGVAQHTIASLTELERLLAD